MNTTTRKQLRGYGLSTYLATAITQNLTPIHKEGRILIYNLNEVIAAIRKYLSKTQIKPQTRITLESLLETLLQRMNNVISIPFTQTSDPQLSLLAQQAFKSMRSAETHFAQMKATLATIKG
ncbi:hypothetical protein [Crocosphaera sp.]|uniref:hypothetical protein n=1 Tax=Crocosphaera sp. TaxID=2729996 RepID=UPI00262F1B53|nr:hypothetical protein [Crocosphaera sp.]MDJ0583432.1 hypothetical protein [Crocosphaera sp.]